MLLRFSPSRRSASTARRDHSVGKSPVTSAEASDEALMLRYQRGDRSAFATLVRRHQVNVYNFVLRELGSALTADQIAQEVFLGVVREGARFNYETRFATRLFSIACQLVRQERDCTPARRILQGEPGSPESGLSGLGSAGETLEDSIVRAVDDLPDEQKDVFLLREVADLPFSEIATVTQQSENAVKVQMQHALQRLRVALQNFDEYRRALR
jgi:RNA polymerase sigma-70 factor, ECF subfamily